MAITALWDAHMVSAIIEITVLPVTPEVTYHITITDVDAYGFEVIFGDYGRYGIHFYDQNNVEVDKNFKAELLNATGIAEITTLEAKQVNLRAYDNTANIKKVFTLRVWNEEHGIEMSQNIKVIGY